MIRSVPALVLVTLAGLAACGDNSQQCGTNTTTVDGVCIGTGGGTICGDGTTLDTTSGTCVPSPTLCGNGTVLINGSCQDPTAGLTIDLEEGPEPNGFEANAAPAGNITLKAIGDPRGFVVHGCVKPVTDFADLDAYRLTVTAPTLIDLSADGVHGLAAGFVMIGTDDALGDWERFGINLANDTSHREIYLPKAGVYQFVMSDTRSLLGLVDGASDVLEPAGNPDGTSCYYVTLNQLAIPAPTVLAVPAGTTGTFDGKLHFYSATLPNGFIDLVETIDSTHAAPALSLAVSGQFRAVDNTGDLLFAGIQSGDTTTLIADFVYDYGFGPSDFALTFNSVTTALALPTDGSVLATTIAGKALTYPNFTTVNQFYFDATAADQIFGMNVVFSKTMQGVIADSSGTFFGRFGGLGSTPNTFTSYKGLWRAPAAGRYYFLVFDPTVAGPDAVGQPLTVTSTLASLTPGTVVLDTPLVAQAPNAFNSTPYTFDLATTTWDTFDATGTTTGALAVSLFDPATAFGRLDPVTLSASGSSPGAAPLAGLALAFPETGGAIGYVTQALGLPSVLVKVNAAAPSGSPTFALDFATRVFTNLGAILAAHSTMNVGDTADSGATHRYYFTTAATNQVTITVTNIVGTGNPTVLQLTPSEGTASTATVSGSDLVLTYGQDATGVTAFSVHNTTAQPITYDVIVDVQPPA